MISYDANSFAFRIMIEQPSGAKYIKFRNEDAVNSLTVSAGVADLEITEIELRIEDTPTVTWDISESHSDYVNFINPVVAIKDLNNAANQVIATHGKASGKWYFEVEMGGPNTQTNSNVGIRENETDLGQDYSGGLNTNGYSYMAQGRFYRKGSLYCNDSVTLTYAAGTYVSFVIGVYVDLDNGNMWFTRDDGSIFNRIGPTAAGILGDPENNLNPCITGITAGTYYPAISQYYSRTTPGNAYTTARLNARADNILYLPSGSIFSPWDAS